MVDMTSKERQLNTLRGTPVDRVPVIAPFTWHPGDTPESVPDWQKNRNFQMVREKAEELADFMVRIKSPTALFDRLFILAPPSCVETLPDREVPKGLMRKTVVHTPKGDLSLVDLTTKGPPLEHKWRIEPLIKSTEDAGAILELPDSYDEPDFQALEREVSLTGVRGVPVLTVPSPIVVPSHLMDFSLFLEWTLTEKTLLKEMIQFAFQRIRDRLQLVLETGLITMVRFGGAEQATPPMMSESLFEDLVGEYDLPLYDLVHQHGAFVQLHCHGRVRSILEKVITMGVDAFDPVEPPPQGDVDIAEAKRIVDGRMTLVGNIECVDLERKSREEIDDLVRYAVTSVRRDHFMLYPSSNLFAPVTDRHRDNLIQYMESGMRYGAM